MLSQFVHFWARLLCCKDWLCLQTMACLAVSQSQGCPLVPSNEPIVSFCTSVRSQLKNLSLEADYCHQYGSASAVKLSRSVLVTRQRGTLLSNFCTILMHPLQAMAPSYSSAMSLHFTVSQPKYALLRLEKTLVHECVYP